MRFSDDAARSQAFSEDSPFLDPSPDRPTPHNQDTPPTCADRPDPFAVSAPAPARIIFEFAMGEIKRRRVLVEQCLSMALYWKERTEFSHEKLLRALHLAEQAALACGKEASRE